MFEKFKGFIQKVVSKMFNKGTIQEALKVDEKPTLSSSHTMDITFHHSRNADFVSRMDNVEKMDECTVRINKETYKDLYALMRFVIKVCNAYA